MAEAKKQLPSPETTRKSHDEAPLSNGISFTFAF
jgi:hypothetical protein